MKKNLVLYVLLVFLIAVNSFFLFNYIGKNSNNGQKGTKGPGNFIVKELGFNEAQLEQFREKSQGHHETMMNMSDDIRGLKDKLFANLSKDSVNESTIDSITALVGEKQKAKEVEAFYHFKMIREICSDQQKEKFKNIIKDALHRGGLRGQIPPPPEGAGKYRLPPQED
jgi:protein CpxP